MTDTFFERKSATNPPRIGEVLITEEQIARRIRELSEQIIGCYGSAPGDSFELVLVAIMTGSMIFLADLVRALPLPLRIGIIMVSNYPGTATRAQGVKITYDLKEDITGKDVLVVDDILDTGQTLTAVVDQIRRRDPRSVRTCVLLNKTLNQPKLIRPDFFGFEIPDRFVIGYGLDYDNLFRNYPQIAVLEP